jgi:hypothetical protein
MPVTGRAQPTIGWTPAPAVATENLAGETPDHVGLDGAFQQGIGRADLQMHEGVCGVRRLGHRPPLRAGFWPLSFAATGTRARRIQASSAEERPIDGG